MTFIDNAIRQLRIRKWVREGAMHRISGGELHNCIVREEAR